MGCWKVISTVGKKENQVSWGIGVPREKVQLIWIKGRNPKIPQTQGKRAGFRGLPQNTENDRFYDRFHHIKKLN